MRSIVVGFTGHRDPALIEFSLHELLLQRVMGLVLANGDRNGHGLVLCQ